MHILGFSQEGPINTQLHKNMNNSNQIPVNSRKNLILTPLWFHNKSSTS